MSAWISVKERLPELYVTVLNAATPAPDPLITFPRLGEFAVGSPAVPFVNYFVKRGKHLWCLRCDSSAQFLPHRCVEVPK